MIPRRQAVESTPFGWLIYMYASIKARQGGKTTEECAYDIPNGQSTHALKTQTHQEHTGMTPTNATQTPPLPSINLPPPIMTIIRMHTNPSSTTPTDNKLSLHHLPTPLPPPHPLKLPHKRLLHLLIPRPRLAHLLHAQRSNNSETQRAERRLFLADGRVGRDADSLEKAEVGGVAIVVQKSAGLFCFVGVEV
jgi:hypothetical protein